MANLLDNWGDSFAKGMQLGNMLNQQKVQAQQMEQQKALQGLQMEDLKEKVKEHQRSAEEASRINQSWNEETPDTLKQKFGPEVAPLITNKTLYQKAVEGVMSKMGKEPRAMNEAEILTLPDNDQRKINYLAGKKALGNGQAKPINMEVSYDSLGASYFPDYTINPESQKAWNVKYTQLMSTPEGRAELLNRRQSIMPPSYAYPFTDQGMVPVITRGAGAGGFQGPTDFKKPAPAGELAKSGAVEALINDINSVKELYKLGINGEEKTGWVGPVDARWGGVKEKYLGGLPEAQVKFYSYVRDMQDALLRARSGAQINEQEFRRLVAFLPSEKLPADSFKPRLERFEAELNNILKSKQDVFSAAGYGSVTSRGQGTTKNSRPPLSAFDK